MSFIFHSPLNWFVTLTNLLETVAQNRQVDKRPGYVSYVLTLVNNYASHLYDEGERAKIALSSQIFEVIRLKVDDGNCGNCLDLWQPITRTQFEALIAAETRRIEECLLDTLERSGLAPEQIDAVVRTGGSAQIPRFVEMLDWIFGSERVVLSEVFGSVTAGLAIRAGSVIQ